MACAHSLSPIGIFDSGIGGLSVLQAIRKELPQEAIHYIADQAHVPYGTRSLVQVRQFSVAITRYLISQKAKLIVVACNTASAAALHDLRQRFPDLPFVGMEPAIKPAAEATRSRVVGILATPATFQGALYASVVERFASGVTLLQHTCPGLVAQIEAGEFDTLATRHILETALQPMLRQGIDTVVLGCTHYPFVIPMIQSIVGPQVNVIDPAPAVARQVHRVLAEQQLIRSGNPGIADSPPLQIFTTGDPMPLKIILHRLTIEKASVQSITWKNKKITG